MLKNQAIDFLSDENSNKLQTSITRLIVDEITARKYPEQSEKFESNFKNLYDIIKDIPDNTIPYAQVAQAIFHLNNEDSESSIDGILDILKQAIVFHINQIDGDEIDTKTNILIKIYEHLVLANTQMNSLYSDQQSQVTEIKTKLDGTTDRFDETEEAWNGIKEQVERMYTSFVSVLGIFVAIAFTLFGAGSLIKDIFASGNPTRIEIGSKIMLAGFTVILIYLLIVGLFQGMASVIKFDYFFSIRKLYIVCFVAGSVILSGYMYGHNNVSWSHLLMFTIFLSLYFLVGAIVYVYGYGYGFKIKSVFIKFGKKKSSNKL